jgi:hypothetical protein
VRTPPKVTVKRTWKLPEVGTDGPMWVQRFATAVKNLLSPPPYPQDDRILLRRGAKATMEWVGLGTGLTISSTSTSPILTTSTQGLWLSETVAVTFPVCPAQSSVDVAVPFPGVVPDAGMAVILGLASNMQFTVNNTYVAFITAKDEVTVREVCVDAFGIGGFTETITITVFS